MSLISVRFIEIFSFNMGEYIDVGVQNSIFPLTIILSSLLLGIYALFGGETENDDDDSDSGSGGLMQPI